MTDVEIIEKQIAQTTDRLDLATARIAAIAQEKQRLGYDLHIGDDQAKAAARTRLGQLRHEFSSLSEERDTLSGAVAELQKRLAAAKQAVGRAEAVQHFKKLHEALDALQKMAAPLDAVLGGLQPGGMGGRRYVAGPANPPLLDRCGECLTQLCSAMRAIDECTRSDLRRGVVWSPGRWGVGHVADLRKSLEGAVQTYCGHLPAPSECNFTALITVLVAAIKKAAAAQHEQTDNAGRVAA